MSHKKLKHIEACLLKESQYNKTTGLENIFIENQSTACVDFSNIDLSVNFLGKTLKAPLMIAPMTGGMEKGAMLNERFSRAAEFFGLAFGVGSQRLALEKKEVEETFKVRKYAKNIFLFANLGACQLKGLSEDKIKRAVDMIDANALFIHINPLQELLQEDGDRDFSFILKEIERVCKFLQPLGIKVLAREVCFGFSEKAVKDLITTGVDGLDSAGAGGTSWAKVEGLCSLNPKYQRLAQTFGEWGIPTAESIKNVRKIDKNIPLIATGGIKTGLDVVKCLYLGANIASMARSMLIAALNSEKELFLFIENIIDEIKIAKAIII